MPAVTPTHQRAKGAHLPQGCIIDREGKPSTDPNDFYAGGALVPLGGNVAGHKGYSVALASALLGGLAQIDAQQGIALPSATWDELRQVAARFHVSLPGGID